MSGPKFNYYDVTKKPHVDKEKAYELWTQGLSDKDIAAELGVRGPAVTEWRRKLGLKVNKNPKRPKPAKQESKLAADARAAREAGMNYGEWKAQQWETAGRPKYRRGAV